MPRLCVLLLFGLCMVLMSSVLVGCGGSGTSPASGLTGSLGFPPPLGADEADRAPEDESAFAGPAAEDPATSREPAPSSPEDAAEGWESFWQSPAGLQANAEIASSSSLSPARFSNGQLIKDDRPPVYVYYNGYKNLIPNPTTFEALGWSWRSIIVCSRTAINAIPTGTPVPHTDWGSLLKDPKSPAVYLTWGGRWLISNPQTLYDLRGTPDGDYSPWNHITVWPGAGWPVPSLINVTPWPSQRWHDSSRWGSRRSFPPRWCTWYVSKRRFIAWSGDAKDWMRNAAAAGFPTGSDKAPVPGAIMCWGGLNVWDARKHGHVALVERVWWDRGVWVRIAHGYRRTSDGKYIEERRNIPVGAIWGMPLQGFIY